MGREKEGILFITGWMIVECVERIKAKPFRLHFCGLGYGETDFAKNRNNFPSGLGQGMQTTLEGRDRRKGGVNLIAESLKVFDFLDRGQSVLKQGLDDSLCLIECLTKCGPVFFRYGTNALCELSQAPIGT